MFKSVTALGMAFIVAAGLCQAASAATVNSLVGDKDGLGIPVPDGGSVPFGLFDNRSVAEGTATNGAQNTDLANGDFGFSADFVDFTHSYGAIGDTITGVTLTFGIGGMQSNDNNPATKLEDEDGLFIDGVLVADAFESIFQGPFDFDVISIALAPGLFALFADGSAVIRIDSNSNGGTNPGTGASPIWYDFSEVEIQTTTTVVPLPAALPLFAGGLGALGLIGWRRRRQAVPAG